MSVGIEITKDTATPALEEFGAKALPRFMADLGPRATVAVAENFLKQGTNKKGWPTTHLWARAAESTNWQLEGEGLEMSVTVGTAQTAVRQRYKGGEIRPVNASSLAYPISPVSYGRTPRDFPDTFVIWTKKGGYIVQRGETINADTGQVESINARKLGGNFKQRIKAALNFLFRLAKSVNQDADPGVIPSDDEFDAIMHKSAEVALQ